MNENERIIILLDHFSRSKAQSALKAFAASGGDASRVIVAPVTDLIATQTTSEVIHSVATGHWTGGTPRTKGTPGALIACTNKRDAVALMRCFKAVLPKNSDPAFAMVTETGKKWTVDQYFNHVRKEHEFMKTANPEDDPDMQEVT